MQTAKQKQKKEPKKMTKEKEIEILKETAHALGCNSYCGQWLADILPHLVDCIAADMLPEVYFSEARYESEARAKQLAIVQAAEKLAQFTVAEAGRYASNLKAEAREEIAREREKHAKWQASLLDIMRAGVRNLENI